MEYHEQHFMLLVDCRFSTDDCEIIETRDMGLMIIFRKQQG